MEKATRRGRRVAGGKRRRAPAQERNEAVVSVRLPGTLAERARKLAKAEDRSLSYYLRRLIIDVLEAKAERGK